MKNKFEIIENFIKVHSFGKVQNTLLHHFELVKKTKISENFKIQLEKLYEDYLKSFIQTNEMRDILINEFRECKNIK